MLSGLNTFHFRRNLIDLIGYDPIIWGHAMWKREIGSGGIFPWEGRTYPFLDGENYTSIQGVGPWGETGQPTKFNADKAPKVLITWYTASWEVAEDYATGGRRSNSSQCVFCSCTAHQHDVGGRLRQSVLDYIMSVRRRIVSHFLNLA